MIGLSQQREVLTLERFFMPNMTTLIRTSVTGKQLTYQVIAYKIIGTKKYAICVRDGMQMLLPV